MSVDDYEAILATEKKLAGVAGGGGSRGRPFAAGAGIGGGGKKRTDLLFNLALSLEGLGKSRV